MFAEDDDDVSNINATRFPVMPSLVSLQQMRNRLHLAYLGKKLMKWTAISTGKELRRLAIDINDTYRTFAEDVRNAFILLARARYFFPDLNKMALSDIQKEANVTLTSKMKALAGVKVIRYVAIVNKKPYAHLGISEGGQSIQEAKDAWLELLKRLIMMVQLRINYIQVDGVHKNANKKQNVLSKVLIPRILATIHYILTELEEREREETFRLKRIKQKKIKEKEIKDKGGRKNDKVDDGNNDRRDDDKNDGKDDGKDVKILKDSSFTIIIKEDEVDIKEDVKYDEKYDNKYDKKDDEIGERKYDVMHCSCCETIIKENKITKDFKLSTTAYEPISESKSEVFPYKKTNSEEVVKNLISIIANVMKSTELIKVGNLVTTNLDNLLSTCNEIKNKLGDYDDAPLCAVCKRNMLDHITKTNAELLKTNATRFVSSASNSTKTACHDMCDLVSSTSPSTKGSDSQLNKSGTEKYHMCKIHLPGADQDQTKEAVSTSQTRTTSFVPSTSDSIKLACQDACILTHSAEPSSGQEVNNINVKYHMCNKNLQDDDIMVRVEPLRIPSQTPINKLVPSEPDSSICPTCQGTLGFMSSLTLIKPVNIIQNKSDSKNYHICQKKLQDEVTQNMTSQTRVIRSLPSVNDVIKPSCKALCSSAPPPSPPEKFVPKRSIEAIEQPVATYEFNSENDNQFGYFEKKFKETIKIKRLQNEDGTVSEEKQTIIIKTEKIHPPKNDDRVPGSSMYDSDSEYNGGCACGGRGVHGTRNDNDNGTSDYLNCRQRRTRSEHVHKNNKMGNPKVRSCMSVENQKRATCKESMAGFGNDKSCYMIMKASGVTTASEPKRLSSVSDPLNNDSCICCSTNKDSGHGSGLRTGSCNSMNRATGRVSRSSVQWKTKSIGTEAVWRDVSTSITDLFIVASLPTIDTVLHNSILNFPKPVNSMKNKVDECETKDNSCNFKVSSKKAKPSYSDDCNSSCNEVILKGSLLNALKDICLPQTATKFSHGATDSMRKEKHFFNLSNKLLLNKISQKLVKSSVEARRTKSDESEKSFCFKVCSPMPYTCSSISYPSHDSWKLRRIDPKSPTTPSSYSCCVTCHASQQEIELSSSGDEQSSKLTYGSCQSIGAVTSDKIYKEFPEICCKNSNEKELIFTEHLQKHNCSIAKDIKISKPSVEATKKEGICKRVHVKAPESSVLSEQHREMNCCKSNNFEYPHDECRDFDLPTSHTKTKHVFETPKLEVQTKDVGTCTNRSSTFDVRSAKLQLGDKIRGNCACQSDTQILRSKFITWLPIKPVQKCRSTHGGNDCPFKQ